MFAKIKEQLKVNDLIKKGNKVHSKDLVLLYQINNKIPTTELIIIVPKKKFKKAIARNYIRRQITAIIYQNKIIETLNKKYSIVVMVREFYNPKLFLNNKQSILKTFKRLGEIKDEK